MRGRAISVLLLLLSACTAPSEAVSTDICQSGRRWRGGETPDEEMEPGTDCVGCHLEKDGPLFVAGGTVYGSLDNQTQIENKCYGLAGVTVEIEGADGRVWSMLTNRAGNFFFDGTPALLVKPYVARLSYTTPDGKLANPQMVVSPSNGGCAHCHDARAMATPDLTLDDPDYVEPASGLFVQ